LISYKGKTLIEGAVDRCLEAQINQTLVVLGSHFDEINPIIEKKEISVIQNISWSRGMGFSLAVGLKEVLKRWPEIKGLVISLADQPLVTAVHIKKLLKEFKSSGRDVVATGYRNTFGPPLICSNEYFCELIKLDGDKGAKAIFNEYSGDIRIIEFSPAGFDVDTMEDMRQLE